ncbi:hypothetical protein [Abyssisolibacter fermentans]|uniref:hypothetical protein n=1 Tax=Abyssisolibacter fermentans TaxID=1766203 RepID=UPI000835ECAB|nr:hypothetical protein [Abyssisolibacter fermentans]
MYDNLTIVRTQEKAYKKYCVNDSIFYSNNFFIALDKKNNIIATGELYVQNHSLADLYTKVFNDNYLEENLIDMFFKECLYWNPYIETITCTFGELYNENPAKIFETEISSILPCQLTVSDKKLKNVTKWLDSPEKVIVPVVEINKALYLTDGHTRLVRAYLQDYQKIYAFYDQDIDATMYPEFIKWCENEDITSINALSKRIVSEESHKKLWLDRCQEYIKNNRT